MYMYIENKKEKTHITYEKGKSSVMNYFVGVEKK